jgi:hypothetical protein
LECLRVFKWRRKLMSIVHRKTSHTRSARQFSFLTMNR